jgi:hypothetical protein
VSVLEADMSDARNLTMSTKELDRLEVIGRVLERRLTQRKAAEQLGLSLRQVERLCRSFRSDGAAGLVSRKRGRRSNRKLVLSKLACNKPGFCAWWLCIAYIVTLVASFVAIGGA